MLHQLVVSSRAEVDKIQRHASMEQCALDHTMCWEPTRDATASDDSCAGVSPAAVHRCPEDPHDVFWTRNFFLIPGVSCFMICICEVTFVRGVEGATLLWRGVASLLAPLPFLSSRKDVRTLFQQDFLDGGTLLKRDLSRSFVTKARYLVGWL